MIVHLLTALQDENSGLINAIEVYAGSEGGDVTVKCSSSSSDSPKFICRQKCEEGSLLKTSGVRAQSGRYSLEWRKEGDSKDVFMTIRQLTKSDSGLYRCGVNESEQAFYKDIQVIVVDGEFLLNVMKIFFIVLRNGGNYI